MCPYLLYQRVWQVMYGIYALCGALCTRQLLVMYQNVQVRKCVHISCMTALGYVMENLYGAVEYGT